MRRRFYLKWAFIQILLYVFYNMCKGTVHTNESSYIAFTEDIVVEALVDGSAKMPCEVEKKDDIVEFVFWYKNDGVTALYTLDARDRPHLQDATHMKNETYADRVQFYLESTIPYLQMDKLTEEDNGDYFCRVDYQWSATELKKVELVVVLPPRRVVIQDDSGQEVRDIAGPYKERSDVTLICEAQRGYPSPNVTWWRDGKLWDNTFKKGSNSVFNEMKLRNLSRSELMTTFQCKAQNTKLAPPLVKKIVIDLYLYPVTVQIAGRPTALSAGRPIELTCQTVGSRPPAKISWWLNGTQLTDHLAEVRENATSSRLRLQPKVRHNRCTLSCRAENPKLQDGLIEDNRILNITCGHTSGVPASDQGGSGSPAKGGRLCTTSMRRGLEPALTKSRLAVQRTTPFPQRVSDRRRKWKHTRLQETYKTKQGALQVLRHQRRRQGCKPGTHAEHQSRTSVQGKSADNVRSGSQRERCGEMRGGSSANGRHIQMGVQQHDPETLRPAPHEQRNSEQRHLPARHSRRLRHAVLLGKQQYRSSADVMFLHSNSSRLQTRESKFKRFKFVQRRK